MRRQDSILFHHRRLKDKMESEFKEQTKAEFHYKFTRVFATLDNTVMERELEVTAAALTRSLTTCILS